MGTWGGAVVRVVSEGGVVILGISRTSAIPRDILSARAAPSQLIGGVVGTTE